MKTSLAKSISYYILSVYLFKYYVFLNYYFFNYIIDSEVQPSKMKFYIKTKIVFYSKCILYLENVYNYCQIILHVPYQ